MKKSTIDFSDIEPYRDRHVTEVLSNLVKDTSFVEVMEYVFPEKSMEEIIAIFSKINTVYEFQREIAYTAMKRIIDATVEEISISGLENISSEKKHLYISNHRDIILDSALFNVMLFEKKIETTETAIGNNLLGHPTVNALTKLNKNFIVSRDLKGRELYSSSMKLSQYIRHSVTTNNSSIWISQREGRAKDGNDKTQKGLVKMLAMSGKGDVIHNLEELDIRTLSISYEYDPCDVYKLRELLAREENVDYVKAKDEDKMSIIAGITGSKGRMAYNVGRVKFDRGMEELTQLSNADQIQFLCDAIDQSIYQGYTLWPNNYIALDRLNNTRAYADENYTLDDERIFDAYCDDIVNQLDDKVKALPILLKKYAYPLINMVG